MYWFMRHPIRIGPAPVRRSHGVASSCDGELLVTVSKADTLLGIGSVSKLALLVASRANVTVPQLDRIACVFAVITRREPANDSSCAPRELGDNCALRGSLEQF